MPDLIAWLREELDQDAEGARVVSLTYPPPWKLAVHGGEWRVVASDGFVVASDDQGGYGRSDAEWLLRCDPAAVLADIAAKRAVLDLRDEWHENLRAWQVPEGQTRPEHLIAAQGWYQALTHAVALLAQGYADRPGFDPSWRTG